MSGVGRGRGWLNIKNGSTRPVGKGTSPKSISHDLSNEESTHLEINHYKEIISLIKQINLSDDGILMNRKLLGIYHQFGHEFQSDEEIKECTQYIFQLGLKDEALAINYATMMSLKPFLIKPIYDRKLRDFLIDELQEFFNNAPQKQISNPREFRNFVQMLARYFCKAKMIDGTPMKIFAGPVISCLEMLLDGGKPEDLESFTKQLNITFVFLKDICNEDLEELLNKVRSLLIKNEFGTNKCRLWLLLALDMTHFKFGCIPTNLYNLYAEQLGEKVMSEFQGSHTELSIQTQRPSSSDGFPSDVNLLQPCIENNLIIQNSNSNLTKTNSYQNPNHYKPNITEQSKTINDNKIYNQNHLSDTGITSWDIPTTQSLNREKTGRPILGAGARFNKPSENWKSDDATKKQSSGWDNKLSKQGFQEKKFVPKQNKGWQHDDRFETDYDQ